MPWEHEVASSNLACPTKRSVAQSGRASALGAEGHRFESGYSDQFIEVAMNNSDLKDKLINLETGRTEAGLPSLSPTMKLMSITNDALKKFEKFYGLYRLGNDEEYTAVHGTIVYLTFYDAKKLKVKDDDNNEVYLIKFYPIEVRPYLPKGADIDTVGCSTLNPDGEKIEVTDLFHYRKYMDLYNAFAEFSVRISKSDFKMNMQMTEAGYIMLNQVWQLPDHALKSVTDSVKAEKEEFDQIKAITDERPLDCQEVSNPRRRKLFESINDKL